MPTPSSGISLTKTDVELDEYRVYRQKTWEEVSPGEWEEVTRWYMTAGYKVTTAEGEEIQRDFVQELMGAILTRATALFSDGEKAIKKKEGLSP